MRSSTSTRLRAEATGIGLRRSGYLFGREFWGSDGESYDVMISKDGKFLVTKN